MLLDGIINNDESALNELYDLCVEQVYHIAYSILRNEADSEEVACDVFEYAWRKASFYSNERSSVMSWLLMISRSKAIDLLRQRKPVSSLSGEFDFIDIEDDDFKPDELIAQFQENSVLKTQINSLNEIQQHVIALAYFKDLSHQQIALALQLPLGTVKSHIRRALLALHSILSTEH